MHIRLDMAQLFHETTGKSGTIYFCRFEDSTDDLVAQAKSNGIAVMFPPEIHHEKRKREWLVLKMLLMEARIESVLYHENGKPYLNDGRYISISHGESLAGILVSDNNVGLDIQKPDEKLKHIKHKFCNEVEMKWCIEDKDELEKLAILWTSKEAVFKYFGEQVHFALDITVDSFSLEQAEIFASYKGVHGKRKFPLHHGQIADYHYVFTTDWRNNDVITQVFI